MFAMLETKPQLRLVLTVDVPKSFEQLVYFVRDPAKFVTKENIGEVRAVQCAVHAKCCIVKRAVCVAVNACLFIPSLPSTHA
eukprot:1159301-Pelagomonas_calceolata.AAC.9